jgi:phosphoglycerol transferase MdoB-like AlkP superfamily enzyme
MTLQAVESFLFWIGLVGFLVSGAAFVTTRLDNGLGQKLVSVARRLGVLAGLIIVLMFAASLCGYRVTPSDLLASLKSGIRDAYGQMPRFRRAAPDTQGRETPPRPSRL